MLRIFIDADACPVKNETYRVAKRYGLEVAVVANRWMQTPLDAAVSLQVVAGGLDAADDWIVEHVEANDIVVTADIPLAQRCLGAGAAVLGPKGKLFTDDNIGEAVAVRDLLADLRSAGTHAGGPAPLQKQDRSRFLQALDETVRAAQRRSRLGL
ncbi:MAG: YaiI/YqxD family protein [Acidobacteriota bacterium]